MAETLDSRIAESGSGRATPERIYRLGLTVVDYARRLPGRSSDPIDYKALAEQFGASGNHSHAAPQGGSPLPQRNPATMMWRTGGPDPIVTRFIAPSPAANGLRPSDRYIGRIQHDDGEEPAISRVTVNAASVIFPDGYTPEAGAEGVELDWTDGIESDQGALTVVMNGLDAVVTAPPRNLPQPS